MQEVTELDGPLAEGVFLTDGVVNLAILHFKSDEAAQGTGKDFVGIHHIGFWVDDVVEQGKIARNAGATWIMGDPNNPDGYEVKHTDLSGHHLRHRGAWLGRFAEEPGRRRTTSCTRTRSAGWRSSTSGAPGRRRRLHRCGPRRQPPRRSKGQGLRPLTPPGGFAPWTPSKGEPLQSICLAG